MPFRNLDAVAFINEPPEFEYIGGLFHVRQRYSDSCVIERVMRPHVFMLSLKRAAEVAGEHFKGAEIIDFARKAEKAAAGH